MKFNTFIISLSLRKHRRIHLYQPVFSSSVNMFWTVLVAQAFLLLTYVSAQEKCGVPGAVYNLKAEKTTNTTAHLSWQPPASTECLDHYKIAYCSYLGDKCSNKTIVLSLNTTQYDVTGLKPCTSNVVQVYTVGKDGGETITEILLYTGSGDPPKIDKVNLKDVEATNITIGWKRPSGFSNLCYPGYEVCYSAKGDNKETCSYAVKDDFATLSAVPLSPCTEYNFSVATVDGNFAADSKTSEKTHISVVTAPQMPNVSVEVHKHTGYATWKTPDNLSMTCAARYLVENCRMTRSGDCNTVSSQTLPSNATEATIAGLNNCSKNHIIFNLVGHNGHSSSTEIVVQDPNSDIPVPTGARVTYVTASEMTLYYYNELNDCMNSFRACWFMDGEAETCRHTTLTTSLGSFKNLTLNLCSNYTLHFTAIGSGGRSSENFTTTFSTGPGKVENLTLHENTTSHTVSLSWVNPPHNQLCVQNIEVTSIRLKGAIFTTVELPNNATMTTLPDITPCSEYMFEVSAKMKGVDSNSDNYIYYTTSCSDANSSH